MRTNLTVGALALTLASAAGADITKLPDVGPYWNPVGPNGSYVYADSFIADQNFVVTDLGSWMTDDFSGGSSLRFEVWGDAGGPDAGNVLSTTGSITPVADGNLNYNQYAASPANLVNGTKYWFAVTAVGEAGSGSWRVGGHTQNSGGIVDNGTFWYSNDPSGVNFDGQNLTPEMAFSVIGNVPTPGSATLLGLAGLAATRRRRA